MIFLCASQIFDRPYIPHIQQNRYRNCVKHFGNRDFYAAVYQQLSFLGKVFYRLKFRIAPDRGNHFPGHLFNWIAHLFLPYYTRCNFSALAVAPGGFVIF